MVAGDCPTVLATALRQILRMILDHSFVEPLRAPSLGEIREMRERISGYAVETPLLELETTGGGTGIYVKLENLQRLGAFKIRPAAALLGSLDRSELEAGVLTASSGNFGAALAWVAREMGIPATAVVPREVAPAKLNRMHEFGARVHYVSAPEWWDVIVSRRCPGLDGVYMDAVCDRRAMAGNGTIGLEILDQLPEADTVLVPFGGGGLLCGIAAAAKALKPDVRIVACESELATPLAAALAAGAPVDVSMRPGFITGLGAPSVLPGIWPLLRRSIGGHAVVSLEEVTDAIRDMAERIHVIAEGAGAVSVAAARSGRIEGRKVVCVVSGGNISAEDLATILEGGVPPPAAD